MTERLQKFLASAGIGSRRGCEQLIKDGKIIVNGKVAELGTTVSEKDIVEFDNKSTLGEPYHQCNNLTSH